MPRSLLPLSAGSSHDLPTGDVDFVSCDHTCVHSRIVRFAVNDALVPNFSLRCIVVKYFCVHLVSGQSTTSSSWGYL